MFRNGGGEFHDPDAKLDIDLMAEDTVSGVRLERRERSVRCNRDGHLLIHEVITGPISSLEQRSQENDSVSSANPSGIARNAVEGGQKSGDGAPREATTALIAASKTGKGKAEAFRPAMFGVGRNGAFKSSKGMSSKSKLGNENDVYLTEARDVRMDALENGLLETSTPFSWFTVKAKLKIRRACCLGHRDNGNDRA